MRLPTRTCFNVDREFSNVLDGLVLVDLRQSDPVILGRYMGESGLHAFRARHGLFRPADMASNATETISVAHQVS